MTRNAGLVAIAALVALVSAQPSPALAGEVTKSAPFALDAWIDLGVTDGPVTLHRIRIASVSERGLTKSKLFRPGNSEYLQTVQIELEYTNSADRDWEADLDVVWKDASGVAIDGYHDDESLDERSHRDDTTVTLSTFRYGLDRAKTLEVEIEFHED